MKFRIGLIGRIIIAIALAVGLGLLLPAIHEGFANWVVRLFATFNMLFGGFLNFVVPLIIIGFIAPGIAQLGKGSGKLLGIATVFAYASTIFAGIMAFVVATAILPNFIGSATDTSVAEAAREAGTAFFDLEMPPVMGIMTALLIAFLFGIGMASIGSKTMLPVFEEFQLIIEKVISFVIIPLLPVHIFGIFLNMTYTGEVGKVLSVFALVFVMIIILHLLMLTIQYTVAGAMSKRNPLFLMKTMAPAYFTALGTQSSAATIPVTLRQARKTGASEKVTDFTIPLFATIHLSGSTITLVSCSIGVLLMNGLPVSFAEYLPFILMLGVTMIAAPGVPGGAVMAAVGLLSSMLGFSEAMVALMIALYMAQDSFGTATNVTGDGAIAIMVDKFTKK
ncbi:dicarboxylate/amino acid:cation symporter [Sporosarcina pasteurii]|uniref:Glutamate-aspartate carrier protein n=1 Tax=Sporosarcina pasteurii TaxID=1474 RepID=A0A380CAD1_SPOPA|nr:dicarboxylate/amino acid:cation symporter [Sporosarcina pasteurii]MDS9472754.1 dicarboxylate/amino acid:cation symporter [Sporosarcina pasteurii]QBQ04406.1 dicarboxylate/amino acid:cation symporter [Sporosarcina pasteurii]SUJ15347.1 Glutamate-aspartate carrier protein [Sporosarcina pasteurii]